MHASNYVVWECVQVYAWNQPLRPISSVKGLGGIVGGSRFQSQTPNGGQMKKDFFFSYLKKVYV